MATYSLPLVLCLVPMLPTPVLKATLSPAPPASPVSRMAPGQHRLSVQVIAVSLMFSSSFMVMYIHRNHKYYYEWVNGGRGRGRSYLSLHCHHQNDSCIKMGSDVSHFHVSLMVRGKVTRQCPQTTTLLKRRESRNQLNQGPSVYQPNALPLGQTGSCHSPCQ